MATEKQVQANRENAKKSTGPKTEQGKRTVAGNAVTHGLCAKAVLVWNESSEEWDAMREDILADNRTGSAVEKALLGRVALYAWRLRRAAHVEREMLESDMRAPAPHRPHGLDPHEYRPCTGEGIPHFGGRVEKKMRDDGGWSRFARYESMLQRGLYGAMRELRLYRKLALQEEKADNDIWGPETDKLYKQCQDEARRYTAWMAAESDAAERRLARSIDRGEAVAPDLGVGASSYGTDRKDDLPRPADPPEDGARNKANLEPSGTRNQAQKGRNSKRIRRGKRRK